MRDGNRFGFDPSRTDRFGLNFRGKNLFLTLKKVCIIFDEKGYGLEAHALYYPSDLSFDKHGNVYILDFQE